LSAAAALAPHASVTLLEAEPAIGFHSSGRSATMLHYALGDALVRSLTLASRRFFETPPDGFSDAPLARRVPVLVHAREDEVPALDALQAAIAPFATLDRLDAKGIAELCPLLRTGEGGAVAAIADHAAIRLDSATMLQGFARLLRHQTGEIVNGARVSAVRRTGSGWEVATESGERFLAATLVNAAGAWADAVAALAGVRPLGLTPLKRTIITFDAPSGTDLDTLPFTKTVGDELYFAPESGRLFASPMDEVPSEPCDAQPDEYEVALAAFRIEERTTTSVRRIHHRWSGLRTFAPDRHPVIGFAADVPGFFWLAGQGGFGLQTAPILARAAESLITGTPWPVPDVEASDLSPARFA
jgi:D-arginine dehydrogenase